MGRLARIAVTGVMWVACLAAVSQARETPAPEAPPPVGIEELSRLDLLPRFSQALKTGSVSSYDRTGGNDDGFSGRYSFLRKEGDGLVIAELRGPGCVYRIWTPTPTDDPVEFFFDGEAQARLRLPFRKLFDGTQPPFVAPVSGYGAGGFWTYLPLPYQQSLKVVVRAPRMQFYQINYATYPSGSPVRSFRPEALDRDALEKAGQLLGSAGGDLTRFSDPAGARVRTTRVRGQLAAGKSLSLFSAQRGGRILGLRLSPASALAGKDRAVLLRITWDGAAAPAVLCPAGDFFGYSWGVPAARSLLFGTEGDTCYAWFPMPYDRSARVELVAERSTGDAVTVQAEVIYADAPRRPDEGRFYAVWRRENPTKTGAPFTFVETRGRGHMAGVSLQAQGPQSGNTYFFEGDDQATLDGELAAHGTGSEDFFNGGWYDVPGRWDSRISFPLSGCLDYKKHLGRTGAYRLFLTDRYSFRQSARLTIEHGPEGNAIPADYAAVTYLYLQAPPEPSPALPAAGERAVRDLERLVFTPGWSVPVHSFPFRNATLAKKTERLAGSNEEIRYLSLRAQGEDVFGLHALSLLCEVPEAGRYRVSLQALRGPEQGTVQLFQNERAVGEPVDVYAAERARGEVTLLGTLELREGTNPIFLKLIGKNPQASALGLDLVTLQLERVR